MGKPSENYGKVEENQAKIMEKWRKTKRKLWKSEGKLERTAGGRISDGSMDIAPRNMGTGSWAKTHKIAQNWDFMGDSINKQPEISKIWSSSGPGHYP